MKHKDLRPWLSVIAGGESLVSHAGATLLIETARRSGPAKEGCGRRAARRHVTVDKLNKAIADIVNAFMELDLIRVWGDGSVVAADGTQVDTFIDNLLAETSIRYGGTGGIGYYYISDTYIALFSKFIPVGVWEAVYLIQGLLELRTDQRPVFDQLVIAKPTSHRRASRWSGFPGAVHRRSQEVLGSLGGGTSTGQTRLNRARYPHHRGDGPMKC